MTGRPLMLMGPTAVNLSVTMICAKAVVSQRLTSDPNAGTQTAPPGNPDGAAGPWTLLVLIDQAETRAGSSTMEKRTPALWRLSSETTRQASSASLRVLNGPCT